MFKTVKVQRKTRSRFKTVIGWICAEEKFLNEPHLLEVCLCSDPPPGLTHHWIFPESKVRLQTHWWYINIRWKIGDMGTLAEDWRGSYCKDSQYVAVSLSGDEWEVMYWTWHGVWVVFIKITAECAWLPKKKRKKKNPACWKPLQERLLRETREQKMLTKRCLNKATIQSSGFWWLTVQEPVKQRNDILLHK